MIGKILSRVYSVIIFLSLKIRYGKKVNMHPVNPIRGRMNISFVTSKGSIQIGKR